LSFHFRHRQFSFLIFPASRFHSIS
jgi:hypothetical protein